MKKSRFMCYLFQHAIKYSICSNQIHTLEYTLTIVNRHS